VITRVCCTLFTLLFTLLRTALGINQRQGIFGWLTLVMRTLRKENISSACHWT
jgi:hypothetical protein